MTFLKDIAACAVTGLACLLIGWFGHAFYAKTAATAKAATAQATAVTQAAAVSAKAETHILVTQDRTAKAAEEAHHALAAAPKPAPSPTCDYGPVISAWRSGLVGVRGAANASAGDDPAGRANAVPGTGSGDGKDADGPG